LQLGNIETVESFLTRHFKTIAQSENYRWISELDEAGYSKRDIVELLLEQRIDSPLIYSTSQIFEEDRKQVLKITFHQQDCIHRWQQEDSEALEKRTSTSPWLPRPQPDIIRKIQELCGLGGVIPISREKGTKNGTLTFEAKSSFVTLRGGPATLDTSDVLLDPTFNSHLITFIRVLGRLTLAAALAQSAGLCCDSFTVLIQESEYVEVRRIPFETIRELDQAFRRVLEKDERLSQVYGVATRILEDVNLLGRFHTEDETPYASLQACAQTVQFLCMAFSCYVQSHLGPLNLFFLDTPLEKVTLLGFLHSGEEEHGIHAKLSELTCLSGMTQKPVLVFSVSAGDKALKHNIARYDVVITLEDLLDTWGPGQPIYSKKQDGEIEAVVIGGGVLYLANIETSQFHWHSFDEDAQHRAGYKPFTSGMVMRIGTTVNENRQCSIDFAACRASSALALKQTCTHDAYWEAQQRQVSLQAGLYVNLGGAQTWCKIPGRTLKEFLLQAPDAILLSLLQGTWGLQVSFCTTVARRVPLRELVADLFPLHVQPDRIDQWKTLNDIHDILGAFRIGTQSQLETWFYGLSKGLKRYVLDTIRLILVQLKYTGYNHHDNSLVVAWPEHNEVSRGLKIACKEQTSWAQIIADDQECATFAYISSMCLETAHLKCRGNDRKWNNMSSTLITEVSYSKATGQTVAAMATLSQLQDRHSYYIVKNGDYLWLTAERVDNDVAHLVVKRSRMPSGIWQRLIARNQDRYDMCIRERQSEADHAESVIVRASFHI